MEIILYSFSKKENSTAQPSSGGKSISGRLIEPCSILNPVVGFKDSDFVDNAPNSNYAYIGKFNRYYWVTNWTYDSGIWYATMAVDPLASWKSAIGDSNQYILRCSAESDGEIIDDLYPARTAYTRVDQPVELPDPYNSIIGLGSYVVGIINNSAKTVGAVAYYVFTEAEFRVFREYLMGSPDWTEIPDTLKTTVKGVMAGAEVNYDSLQDFSAQVFKAQFNPFQYVSSVKWFPIPMPQGEAVSALPYGWWTLSGVSCHTLANNSKYGQTGTVTLPKHPQAATRGVYLNKSHYSRYMLYYNVFGAIPLDPGSVGNSTALDLLVTIDGVSGQGVLKISDYQTYTPIQTVTAQCGVDIQIAQLTTDYVSSVTSAVSGVASIMTGSIAGGVSAVTSAIDGLFPQLQTTGGNGSIADYLIPPRIVATFYPVVAENNEHRGRPLCQNRQLSAIPGYIMCADSEISAPCTQEELQSIMRYLESGFFYE